MSQPTTKGRGRTKASQDKSWASVAQKMRAVIEQYPDDNIASHMVRLRELEFSRPNPNAFYIKRDLVTGFGANILNTVGETLDGKLYYPDVHAGAYRAAPKSAMTYLLQHLAADTTDIVEFGSGWGSNLFQLYVGVGATRAKKMRFHGAEYTDSGQEAANTLSGVESALDLRSYGFDYRAPDLGQIDFLGDSVFVLTRHSVEQVDVIDPDLYTQLAKLGKKVTVVHLEPVGWQRDPELVKRRAANDRDFFERIGQNFSNEIHGVQQQRANAAWWSWRMDYNTNLTSIIDRNIQAGRARMVLEALDITAVGNALNPTSLFHLEFTR